MQVNRWEILRFVKDFTIKFKINNKLIWEYPYFIWKSFIRLTEHNCNKYGAYLWVSFYSNYFAQIL